MADYSYEEVIYKIENTHRFGNKPGVEVSASMLHTLGIKMDIPYAHVAGTNGKGSVCAFLGSILKEAGIKTGVFTSPHLIEFEERICVDGEMISKEDVTRIGNILLNTEFDVTPTYFDYCLVMAVIYFREQKCDFAIIETGLGGKLDSTNCLGIPKVTVIAKIGFDHMAILGNTLAEIAGEKAGVIKKGSFVVLEKQEPEARKVFDDAIEKTAFSKEEYVYVTDEDCNYTRLLGLKMLGTHQYENGAAAMKAAEFILKDNPDHRTAIDKGLKNATWLGRLQLISEDPFVMVDGAHNGHGVMALRDSLMTLFPEERFNFYMAVMADKDYETMIEELLPLAESFVTVTLENERAAQSQSLADFISEKGVPVEAIKSVDDIKMSIENQKNGKKNIIFGSLYFVGDVLKCMG